MITLHIIFQHEVLVSQDARSLCHSNLGYTASVDPYIPGVRLHSQRRPYITGVRLHWGQLQSLYVLLVSGYTGGSGVPVQYADEYSVPIITDQGNPGSSYNSGQNQVYLEKWFVCPCFLCLPVALLILALHP